MPRKKYDAYFKTKIVLEILQEEKPLSQIASQSGVHPNQVRQWPNLALELWPQTFEKENRQAAQIKAECGSRLEEPHAETANRELPLTVQANILSLNRTGLYCRSATPSSAPCKRMDLADLAPDQH